MRNRRTGPRATSVIPCVFTRQPGRVDLAPGRASGDDSGGISSRLVPHCSMAQIAAPCTPGSGCRHATCSSRGMDESRSAANCRPGLIVPNTRIQVAVSRSSADDESTTPAGGSHVRRGQFRPKWQRLPYRWRRRREIISLRRLGSDWDRKPARQDVRLSQRVECDGTVRQGDDLGLRWFRPSRFRGWLRPAT